MCALAAAFPAAAEPPELEVDSEVAAAGFYQLRWFSDGNVDLEEASKEDFADARTLYSGSDKARVMSGKPDGIYYYRLRDPEDGSHGNVVKVSVQHHSLRRAFSFFGIGAIVFVATLLLIASGARRGNEAS